MRVLFMSTHNVSCGIADYNAAMMKEAAIYNDCDIEALPQNQSVSKEDVKRISNQAKDYDAVVVQHEWSFFERSLIKHYNRLSFFLKCLRKNNTSTALIMHTKFRNVGTRRRSLIFWAEKIFKYPLVREINKSSNLKIFVHGENHVHNLISQGICPDKVVSIAFPHQPQNVTPKIRDTSNSEDISLLMFGFISAYKGYEIALNAMRILPKNFKLTIAGGQHPGAMHDFTYENILGFIGLGNWFRERKLPKFFKNFTTAEAEDFKKRIVLTGHLSDEEVTKEIEKADIILAPYFAKSPPVGSAAVEKSVSMGKPIVSSSAYTFDNYVKSGCVVAVTPAAPFHLAKAIIELSSSPGEMKRLSEAALHYSRTNSVGEITKQILSVVTKAKIV